MKKILSVLLILCNMYAQAQTDPAYPQAPPAAQNIINAEYFIDADPGFGSATPLSITPGVNIANLTKSINTTGLSNGVHRLYIRSKSQEGRWSLLNFGMFTVDFDPAYPAPPSATQNISGAEYFIDTDPGFGNGTPIILTPGIDIANKSVTINTSGLANGIHRLYLRTKSTAGKWSLINYSSFIVDSDPAYPTPPATAQNIIAAEYFIDTDPGFGSGNDITITPGLDISNINTGINTTGLTNGIHRFYIRTLNAEGRWGLTNINSFEVDSDPAYPTPPAAAQNIIAAEYFIDTDPGFGSGNAITITPGLDISNMPASVNTTGLTNGKHYFYVRTKSQEGKWSLANVDSFFTDLLSISADTIAFGNMVTGTTSIKNLYITNNSTSPQTINSLTLNGPFSADKTAPLTIAANSQDTIQLAFAPTQQGNFTDSVVMNTTGGYYKTVLEGSGIQPSVSWAIIPATGYNFGMVAVNTSSSYTFSIINTGNTAITLSNITSSDASFLPSFIAGTVIGANGGNTSFSVSFNPANAALYTAQLKIISSTPGATDVTTQVTGTGYIPGVPPALSYVAGSPYNSSDGVNPVVGQAGNYTYKVLYKSANNLAPQTGYPQVGIDLNGDQNFGGSGEGVFTMVKEGTGTDYKNGVVYSYVFKHNYNTSTAGYRFYATDANGNTTSTAYKNGPTVTDDQLDLRIFANNISFSDANPQPGDTFTLTATVSNSTAIPATNVPVRFFRDTIPLTSGVIPYIGPKSSGVITQDFTFGAEGFYPIKVWIDSSNTLGDISPLNNYAIRPVIVGSPNLPGGINVTTSASIQNCPQQQVNIAGNAVYYGTSGSSVVAVAGATVTITTGSRTVTTTTDVNGNYTYGLTNLLCGGNFEYNVVVTDYTFTSKPATNVIALPCPDPYACIQVNTSTEITTPEHPDCPPKVGDTLHFTWTLKYRNPDPANFWNTYDYIYNSVLNCYINDTLVTVVHDSAAAPGKKVNMTTIDYIIKDTLPIKFTANGNYTYMESKSGLGTPSDYNSIYYTLDGYDLYKPEPKKPDIQIQGFSKTGETAFEFYDGNTVCGLDVNAHRVVIYDSLPDGSWLELYSETVPGLHDVEAHLIRYSDLTLAPGKHRIKIVTDIDEEVDELDEKNNTYYGTIKVSPTDLAIENITVTPTNLDSGSTAVIRARIKNTGKACGSFKIQFALNGNRIGNLIEVPGVNEKFYIDVESVPFIVTSKMNTCGGMITVQADVFTEIYEEKLANNIDTAWLSTDIVADQLAAQPGSASNPVVVRVNTTNIFNPLIRNKGLRDAGNLLIRFSLGNSIISTEGIAEVKPAPYATVASFSYMFTQPGDYVVKVFADTTNVVCESDETNNEGNFYIRVTDSKPDFEVLSQYISPGSLNPNLNQNITLAGTVRNSGGKPTNAGKLRFLVDDIQIGTSVPINALQPGKDTTVLATATYSSSIDGTKIIKLVADADNTLDEEREDNNEATRAIIVGAAPNMSKQNNNAISLHPATFNVGDSVLVSYAITNKGGIDGAAWVRFTLRDQNGSSIALDSIMFSLTAGSNLIVSKKMFFGASPGTVIAEIVNCTPDEYDLLDNNDTLAFTTSNQSTFYADNDGDGFGDATKSIVASTPPPGYVADNTDCDDTKLLYADNDGDGYGAGTPAACGVSNNTDCNDNDSAAYKPTTYYRDADGDGYGDGKVTIVSCSKPAGYVSNRRDCDDTNPNIDSGFVKNLYYRDADGDGYGNALISLLTCIQPAGYVPNKRDCDDNDPTNTGSIKNFYYRDADGDGYGNSDSAVLACTQPNGYVSNKKDCNDAAQTIHPNAVELCDGIDNDCDGQVDENCKAVSVGSAITKTLFSLDVKLVPNPAGSTTNVTLSGFAGNVTINVINMQGKQLLQKKVQTFNNKSMVYSLDVIHLAAGMYIVNVFDEKGNNKSQMLVVQR